MQVILHVEFFHTEGLEQVPLNKIASCNETCRCSCRHFNKEVVLHITRGAGEKDYEVPGSSIAVILCVRGCHIRRNIALCTSLWQDGFVIHGEQLRVIHYYLPFGSLDCFESVTRCEV